MRISEAKLLLASILQYNLEQYEHNKPHHTHVVPFFRGDPGVGKTALTRQVAREFEVPYFQCIIAQYDAGEMAGLPFKANVKVGEEGGRDIYEDRMIRLRPNYLPDAQVGIFNLDELPQAFLANQNITSQLVNEYRVGEHKISQGITICCTGNKPENKAGTTVMPSHLKDRLLAIPVDANIDDFLDYAAQHALDPRIRVYLKNNPDYLHKFDPGQQANPTPRSWEKASAILSMELPKHIRTEAISGTIGEAHGQQFEAWIRVEDKMPKIDDVIAKPNEAPIFENKQADILYLVLTHLANRADEKNIEAILTYIRRLPNQEFAAYWAQDTFRRNKKLLENKHVMKWKLRDAAKLV